MDLVKHDKIGSYCESDIVARKFGLQHADVVRTIEKLDSELGDLSLVGNKGKLTEFDGHYRGTDYKAYRMDRRFFSLLAMRFKGKKALEWQVKFNDAFYAMEEALLKATKNKSDIEWHSARLMGKSERIEETDAIKLFVEYAKNQGSKNAGHYYSNITNCSYRALELMAQKHPRLRDTMAGYELAELMLAERMISVKLIEYMDAERNYKDIYQCIKEDLGQFSKTMLMVSPRNKLKKEVVSDYC